jgi:DNA recombination-dependent growth factor C
MSFYHEVPTDLSEIKMSVIAALSGCIGAIIGTTVSSKKKDDTIQEMAKSQGSSPVVPQTSIQSSEVTNINP